MKYETGENLFHKILIFGSFSGIIINIDKSAATWTGSEYIKGNIFIGC